MTEQQKRDFDENGFIVLEDFLDPDELERLLAAVDDVGAKVRHAKGLGPGDPFAVRNALAHHEAFLDLIDHPRMLPLVVDAIGWNIQIRTSHLDYRPPYPRDLQAGALGSGAGADHEAGYRNVVWHPDLAGDHLFEAPSLDGRLPFMEVKVFYVLSDLTESNAGNLWLLPGSHRRTPQELRDLNNQVDPDEAVELRLPAGRRRPVAHRNLAHRGTEPLRQDAQGHARRLPLPVAPSHRLRAPGSGAGRPQLTDPPPAPGRVGHRQRSAGRRSRVPPRVRLLDPGRCRLGRRPAEGVVRRSQTRRCDRSQPLATSNAVTLRVWRLNSTPMRWIGSSRPRYLSA